MTKVTIDREGEWLDGEHWQERSRAAKWGDTPFTLLVPGEVWSAAERLVYARTRLSPWATTEMQCLEEAAARLIAAQGLSADGKLRLSVRDVI